MRSIDRRADLIANDVSSFNDEHVVSKNTTSAKSQVLKEETNAVAVPIPAEALTPAGNVLFGTPHFASINVVHSEVLSEKH